jgi:3' exoribonuclease, RNase T-like
MFMFDVETLGVESTCVVLSAALIHFDPEMRPTYQDLLDNACFVKFDAKDQIQRLKRTSSLSTLEWWKNQHEYVRKLALDPSKEDVTPEVGIELLHNYMNKFKNADKQTMWARGSLDQMAIDSLAVKVGMQEITGYNMWRDVRTAVDIMFGTTNGYVEVDHPLFKRHEVIKHHPVHDCALDAMQLMYGKQV